MLGIQCLLQRANRQVAGDLPVCYAGDHTPVMEVYDRAVITYFPVLQKQGYEFVHHFWFGLSAWKSCLSLFSNILCGFPGFVPRFFRADDGMRVHFLIHIFMDGSGAAAVSFTLQTGRHAAVAVNTVVPVADLQPPQRPADAEFFMVLVDEPVSL